MKKKLILPLIGLGMVYLCNAQSLSPSVISSSGTVNQNDKIQLEWTLGEIAIESHQTTNGLLTEGFHQPILRIEEMEPSGSSREEISTISDLDISIRPNPVNALLTVDIKSGLDQNGTITLTDLAGQRLQKLETSLFAQQLEWDFSPFPSGMYFLYFHTKEGKLLKTFKVIKAH
jgi:hypothetical protein